MPSVIGPGGDQLICRTMWAQYQDLLECAAKIEDAWRTEGNACEVFADIVWEQAAALDLSTFGEVANVPELLELPAVKTLQSPSTLSDLYIKLFDNGTFWVEILNWWATDINLHDHNCSGVLWLLKGRSLNVEYAFRSKLVRSGLTIGDLEVMSAEIWQEGDRSIVRPGRAPHIVSHLSVPTVSLIIRTHPRSTYGGQYNYFAPDIAADYEVADIALRKKIATLRLLGQGNDPEFFRALERVLDHQTHVENLFTIVKLMDVVFLSRYAEVLGSYAARGDLETLIVRAAAYYRAQHRLTNGVKLAPGLTDDDILAISVLSCAFSPESFHSIARNLAGRVQSDLIRVINGASPKLDGRYQSWLDSALKLFGVA